MNDPTEDYYLSRADLDGPYTQEEDAHAEGNE